MIVLGSGSAIRARILANAGVPFDVDKPRVDESALKREIGGSPAALAVALAEAKAREVSGRRPGDLVIGADQTLEFDGGLVDKAESVAEARARLLAFRGREHRLHAGTALARDGEIVWRDRRTSVMRVRAFSDAFLDDYMASAGGLTQSVGTYEYEALGAQLFDSVEGDFYAVLGLPLLPLLAALRAEGALPT